MVWAHEEEEWRRRALCRNFDTNLFFPGKPSKEEHEKEQLAKKVCAACSVREPCLEYALKNYDTSGVWGGTSHKERKTIRSRLKSLNKS